MLEDIYTYEGLIVAKLVKIFAEFDKLHKEPPTHRESSYEEIFKIAWVDEKHIGPAVIALLFKYYNPQEVEQFLAFLHSRGVDIAKITQQCIG